jgi:hypothetical protein
VLDVDERNVRVVKEVGRAGGPAGSSDRELAEALEDARREAAEAMREEARSAEAGRRLEVKDLATVDGLAERYRIPPGFILLFNGKPYVTSEGLLIQAQRKGFRAIQTVPVREQDGDDPYYEFEARVYPNFAPKDYELLLALKDQDRDLFRQVYRDLMKPTVARGYACRENVNNPKLVAQKQLKHLAETRARNRALRVYTGCGLVSVAETAEAREV